MKAPKFITVESKPDKYIINTDSIISIEGNAFVTVLKLKDGTEIPLYQSYEDFMKWFNRQ